MFKLLLVDNHRLFLESLAGRLLALPEIDSVRMAADAEEAIACFRSEPANAVLMDVETFRGRAFESAWRIREIRPDSRIVFLSNNDQDVFIEAALQMGANGFLLKTDRLCDLESALSRMIRGECIFSESIRERIGRVNGKMAVTKPRNGRLQKLSRRERELLILLGEGASLKEAAAQMDVSYKTADNQKVSLMRKLDIHDRVELARFAIREGLVGV
jgi:DNA-binding NarL/FixJ family response regulator